MIGLGTLVGLHEHRHELAAYCPRCYRSPSSRLSKVNCAEGDRPRELGVDGDQGVPPARR